MFLKALSAERTENIKTAQPGINDLITVQCAIKILFIVYVDTVSVESTDQNQTHSELVTAHQEDLLLILVMVWCGKWGREWVGATD